VAEELIYANEELIFIRLGLLSTGEKQANCGFIGISGAKAGVSLSLSGNQGLPAAPKNEGRA
jgi:hypothetical protein